MKPNKMNTIIILGIIFLTLVCFSPEAFPWGSGTHALIDDQLNRRLGAKNSNEIYGGMSPDIFNYLFDSDYLSDMYIQTHYNFMNVWNSARHGMEEAVSYGFVSHNDIWGADSTAHIACLTCSTNKGYVVDKAEYLSVIAPIPPDLGIPDEAASELYHHFIESGVDILMKRTDPMIGQKIIFSAMLRSPNFPKLLVRAYAEDFSEYFGGYDQAVQVITSAEFEFRKMTILYGEALLQDEELAILLVSEQMADLAERFLGSYGVPVPPREELVQLIVEYIHIAVEICEGDYSDEITATIDFVDEQLNANGISY